MPPKKRTRSNASNAQDNGNSQTKKAKTSKKSEKTDEEPSPKTPQINKTDSNLDEIDFGCEKLNAQGNKFNLKICSWNVAGIRALIKKNGLEYLIKEDADIIALQETKCDNNKIPSEVKLPGYKRYFADSKKSGYCGVALFAKVEPNQVKYGLMNQKHDGEGRMITAEFSNFYIINVYVPNSGRGLVTLPKRLEWNEDFKKYVEKLDKKKPVIVCGDLNVAHQEIDLKNWKTNSKNAGFTKEERDGMTEFLSSGYIDTFRFFYPDKTDAYTFWSYLGNARAKNVGWRLDYFLVSERIKDKVCDNVIRNEIYGSDHCPIILYIDI